jgi:SAM-dependent methyltransferase
VAGADRRALTPHAAANQVNWDGESASYETRTHEQLSLEGGLVWGVWHVPERELNVLGDVSGKDVLELGCGAARWSIALAGLGARPVGLDLSERQLELALANQEATGVSFPLVQASAESVPLPDASFDVVFCDHGAMTFADPYLTVPEVARLLRPGGLFAFNGSSPIVELATPVEAESASERLVNDYFGMHRFEDQGWVWFQLPYGEWIRLFRENGFEILDLIEVRPPADVVSAYRDAGDLAWARRWPAESIWRLRKRD